MTDYRRHREVTICDCCERDIDPRDMDGLYTCCNDCAWCQSLEHDPCCHGECMDPRARRARVIAEQPR